MINLPEKCDHFQMHNGKVDILRQKMDIYVHAVYRSSKKFPKDEIYVTTSQLRRAALSVILNYIEGYARQNIKVFDHFLSISYGSLKESLYLISFAEKEGFASTAQAKECEVLGEEVAKMEWALKQTNKAAKQ